MWWKPSVVNAAVTVSRVSKIMARLSAPNLNSAKKLVSSPR